MTEPAPAATVVLLREVARRARGAAAAAQLAARLPRRRLGVSGRTHRRAGLGRGRRRGRRAARRRRARRARKPDSRSTRRARADLALDHARGSAQALRDLVLPGRGRRDTGACRRRRDPRARAGSRPRPRSTRSARARSSCRRRPSSRSRRCSAKRERRGRARCRARGRAARPTCRASCASTAARARCTPPTRAGSAAIRRCSGPRNRLWMLESGWRYERELLAHARERALERRSKRSPISSISCSEIVNGGPNVITSRAGSTPPG